MMSNPVLDLEKKLFFFATPGLSIAIALLVLGAVAALNGSTYIQETMQRQTQFLDAGTGQLQEWRRSLVALEDNGGAAPPFQARPTSIRIPMVLPPAPLADFASGSMDLIPTTTTLTAWSNPGSLFSEYEIANPTVLQIGGFDFTFLAVVILPILMIGASFDIVAGDRERGRARLVAAQAGHVGPSVWKRLIMRNLAIWAVFAVIAIIAGIAVSHTASAERVTHLLVWLSMTAIYALFWFAMIAFFSAVLKRSETVAAALFASWAIFVFAVPAISSAVAEASYPPPSRLAFLSEMREAEAEAKLETAELTAGFLADHPELTVSDAAIPAFYQSNFLANQAVTTRVKPLLERFNQSRRQRAALIDKFQYLSPALIINRALSTIAGGDVDRGKAFQEQARAALEDFTARIGTAVVAKQRISVAEFDEIPTYDYREKSFAVTLSPLILPALYLIVASIVLLSLSVRRLKSPLEKLL